ncbi:MAG: toxin [Acidobacteriia bacterium]|nr:toxin [Terriglobia bacterium]
MAGPQDKRAGTEQASNSFSSVSAPSISLPKGGGAIRGIGEKFAANPVTGTGSMTVPIATSPGRSGFGPQLSLSYDSGSGNGPFGLGWHLSIPSIARKTDKGLPRYRDDEKPDVFILSGAEDLVPVLVKSEDGWVSEPPKFRTVNKAKYQIKRYRPRIEGLFARIERWSNTDPARPQDTFWRSISKDNITTWYGKTEKSRISDPADPAHVFSWLICESYDDKGNVISYRYKREDSAGINVAQAHERNRSDSSDSYKSDRRANKYLKRIRYGNRTPYLPKLTENDPWPTPPKNDGWFFEVVFDYGEHDTATPQPSDDFENSNSAAWLVRPDPFSSYRSGFEIRTYRLCQRILMFHHFPDEPEVKDDCLIRSMDFDYWYEEYPKDARNPIYSFLHSVTQTGYKRKPAGGYRKKSFPPVQFTYSEATIQNDVRVVDAASLENLSVGVDLSTYQWVDLDGEGLPGMLSEQAGAWFYKRNLSPINLISQHGSTRVEACFAPAELVATKPASGLSGGRAQFMDLAGDGQPDVVTFWGPAPGFYERTPDSGTWESFTPFASLPVLDWADPNLKFVDLTGDGHADLLITEDDIFRWHPSLAEEGFGPQEITRQSYDEENGPHLVFADNTQSIYLADMSGDGLSDLVRIRNGEVCYWPNLGYGRFGSKITMDNSPWFDFFDQFDQKRIRLADIDGSGTTDILYLHGKGVRIYFNQSGNSWSQPPTVLAFPPIDSHTSVTVLDLLGNGTACIVWSSPLPGDARRPMRYIDLMGGQKPHLMIKTVNNFGAETVVSYAPSTRFYVADQRAGKPWTTKLPFPVHCVERVTVTDKWRQTSFSSRYSYHHGFFDGVEREFRGFGRVEQVDVESYGKFSKDNSASPYITADKTLYQPPVKTVTWYHTGALTERERILSQFEHEYFPRWFEDLHPEASSVLGNFQENVLPEPDLSAEELSGEEWREALRASKGIVLRQEVYELDVEALGRDEQRPVKLFTAACHNVHIRRLQPRAHHQHAVFLVSQSETISYNYELDLRPAVLHPDPRIAHTLNLQLDEYANVLQSVAVVYPRLGQYEDNTLSSDALALISRVQKESHLAYTEARYTNDVPDVPNGQLTNQDDYRLRVPCEVLTYELTGIGPEDAGDLLTPDSRDNRYFTLDELRHFRLSLVHQLSGEAVGEILYHELPKRAVPEKRLVEHTRMLFFKDDPTKPGALSSPLPFGHLGRLGLLYETYKLALTKELLSTVFGAKLNDSIQGATGMEHLGNATIGGYLSGPDLAARFTPLDTTGQYWMRSGIVGFQTDVATHFYLPECYTDAFGNRTMVSFDQSYHLFLKSSIDARGNITSVEQFDFRVLSPRRLKDMNSNLSEVAFDLLGMPAAIALLGTGNEGDSLSGLTDVLLNPPPADVQGFFATSYSETLPRQWLGDSTARHLYWFGEEVNPDGSVSWGKHPAAACAVLRETHVAVVNATTSQPSPVQVAVEYSDGLGSVLVKKGQAEPAPGKTGLRWIANGKTILNNKGKPVKQYEPYFSETEHRFDEAEVQREVGVTPVMYYDAPGRLIRTELPDGSLSRVEFSPWHLKTFDANDTVLESRWYQDHGAPDPAIPLVASASSDMRAAWLASQHANTPALTILDSLGRQVAAIAHNRVDDGAGGVRNEGYLTFTKLDAEGKPLWIRDARGNLVMQYITPPVANNQATEPTAGFAPCHDIAGNLLFQHSMDAGDRWMLTDAAGKPMLAWDYNERQTGTGTVNEHRLYFTSYDQVHRPTAQWLSVNGGLAQMAERLEYRDAQDHDSGALQNKLIGQLVRHYDPSGLTETIRRDFKGNIEEVRRTLNNQPEVALIDWQGGNPGAQLENGTFVQITEYDALNRIIRLYNWHRGVGSRVAVYEPDYNERGLLVSEKLTIRGNKTATGFDIGSEMKTTAAILDIRYNVKGQKTYLVLGNGTLTQYNHDPQTFRLKQIQTTRPADASGFPERRSNLKDSGIVQQLLYTYDPIGNITEIDDQAYKPVFFDNGIAEPRNLYEYDALYRLVSASGRESAQNGGAAFTGNDPAIGNGFPITDQTLRRYIETYEYDQVGNFVTMKHTVPTDTAGCWTRQFECFAGSNRLHYTWTGSNRVATQIEYHYDAHGNMLNFLNVSAGQFLRWDHRDMIANINLGGGGSAYYQYDASKQRTRKSVRHGVVEDRIYLNGYELNRLTLNDNVLEEIESHHLFAGEQRVLLVDDVITSCDAKHQRPDGLSIKAQKLFRYVYNNHLGSVSLELDQDAEIISYEEYHSYGTSAYRAMKSGVEAPPKRYRYTGMERDEESRLAYHNARYYAPWLARWTSCDPNGIAEGSNLFVFVDCNPINFIDSGGKAKDYPSWRQMLAESRIKSSEERISQTKFGTPGSLAARKENMQALQALQEANEIRDFHRNVGFPIAANITMAVATAPAAALTPVRVAFTFLAGFGVGETIQGKTVSLLPSTFGQTQSLSGSDRIWHGVGSVSGVLGSVAGEVKLASPSMLTRSPAAKLLSGPASRLRAKPAPSQTSPWPSDVTRTDAGFKALKAAPGERVFYAPASSPNETVVTRFAPGSVTFDSATNTKGVWIALEELGRSSPGSHVYVGSGTHGTTGGGYAATNPVLAEPRFYGSDVALTRPPSFPTLGPRHVFDVANPAGASAFASAVKTAQSLPSGSMTTVKAWCFSTLQR